MYDAELDADLPRSAAAAFAGASSDDPDGGGVSPIVLDGAPCAPAALEATGPRAARVTLTEGRYHQVKRMFASQGRTVTRLHRVSFGEYDVAGLKPGEWRDLPLPEWCEAAGGAGGGGA